MEFGNVVLKIPNLIFFWGNKNNQKKKKNKAKTKEKQ
jgi:hypothetical protein